MSKRFLHLIAILGILAVAIPGEAVVIDRIVAVVNDEVVTLSELQSIKYYMKKEKEPEKAKGDNSSKDQAESEKRLLDEIIEKRLQLQQARLKKIQVPEDQVQAALKDLMQRNNIATEERFARELAAEGITLEHLRRQIEENIMITRLINTEVRPKVLLTDDDIAEYYHAHDSEFRQEELSARHILFPLPPEATDKEIQEIEGLAGQVLDKFNQQESGYEFDKLTGEFERKYPTVKTGDLGYFTKGQILPEMEQAVWGLPAGKAAIVRTKFGVHLVQITDRKLHTLDDDPQIKERVKQALYKQKLQQELDKWLADLHKKAAIKIML